MKLKVIILAMSDKHNYGPDGGYCAAGIAYDAPHGWIRLIGLHEHFKITKEEALYEDGRLCAPLDVIETEAIPVTEALADRENVRGWGGRGLFYEKDQLRIQPENYLATGKFRFVEKVDIDRVLRIARTDNELYEYIYLNTDKRLSKAEAVRNNRSLTLVRVEKLELYPVPADPKEEEKGWKEHYKARFICNGRSYEDITCTDPDFGAKKTDFAGLSFGDTCLIISVGESFRGDHYKLIAKIFEIVYTTANNRYNFFHAFSDCMYLEKYSGNLNYALYGDLKSKGMTHCKLCEKRLGGEASNRE